MQPPDLARETHAALADLDAMDPHEAIVRAQAMMGAATVFLTRLAGHDVVSAMLRRDADTVASYRIEPGEPPAQSGALN